jgi:hypothetical protein
MRPIVRSTVASPQVGPLLRVWRPHASEWAKVKEKNHLLER